MGCSATACKGHCQIEGTAGRVAGCNDVVRYPRYRFPAAIIRHAVWLYYTFTLSFRDVEDLLAHRGITVSYESIRHWCETFGLAYARGLRQRAGPVGDPWHLDELFVTIRGERQYLWRAVDQDGDVTDRLGSYRAAHQVIMPSVVHDTTRYANNRAEVSHQPTRQREFHMRRFKSAPHAQRFLTVYDAVRNPFTVGRRSTPRQRPTCAFALT